MFSGSASGVGSEDTSGAGSEDTSGDVIGDLLTLAGSLPTNTASGSSYDAPAGSPLMLLSGAA